MILALAILLGLTLTFVFVLWTYSSIDPVAKVCAQLCAIFTLCMAGILAVCELVGLT